MGGLWVEKSEKQKMFRQLAKKNSLSLQSFWHFGGLVFKESRCQNWHPGQVIVFDHLQEVNTLQNTLNYKTI